MTTDPSRLISLFENATEGIILTNGIGNIVLVNPAAQRMFGYVAEELIGRPIETLLPRRVREHHVAVRESFSDNPQNRVMGHGRDLYGKRKDDSEIPVEVSLSYYSREQERFVIAFVVDITQRKKIENNLLVQKKELEQLTIDMRRLNAQLEAKVEERTLILQEALEKLEESQLELSEALSKEKELNEIKSSFVSMASHEFRTPLTTVLSSAALLGKYTQTDEQHKRDRHIKKIKDSVKHLNDLLEDFLSLGKLSEGKISAHSEPFEVNAFLEETADELKAIVKADQVIKIETVDKMVFNTDKKLLKNILINLLSNAVKFSGETAIIQLQALFEKNRLIISVKDQGIGIPADDLPNMFTSFYRAKNAVNIEGTGLGLHIVKRYADLLNGTVTVESELGSGTTFTISLPALQSEIISQ
ncbi:PAS domain-containing sensor histidine kinase [Flavitalea sp.]|nr:PAS domain-containing sensor histidine kinase [Flavitalea sp.]